MGELQTADDFEKDVVISIKLVFRNDKLIYIHFIIVQSRKIIMIVMISNSPLKTKINAPSTSEFLFYAYFQNTSSYSPVFYKYQFLSHVLFIEVVMCSLSTLTRIRCRNLLQANGSCVDRKKKHNRRHPMQIFTLLINNVKILRSLEHFSFLQKNSI